MNTHELPAYHRIDTTSIVSPELLLQSQDTYRKIMHLKTLRRIFLNFYIILEGKYWPTVKQER